MHCLAIKKVPGNQPLLRCNHCVWHFELSCVTCLSFKKSGHWNLESCLAKALHVFGPRICRGFSEPPLPVGNMSHSYQTLSAAWEHVSLLSVKWLTFHHTGLHIVCHIIIAFGPFSHPSQFQGHHLAVGTPQFPTHQPLAVLGSDYFFSKKSRDMPRHAETCMTEKKR